MLKQVQHDAKGRYRLQGMGSREENRQSIQGFNPTEEVVRAAVCGSFSLCHPELVSGSTFYLSEDRGPLTDNAVFIGIQRILVPKRTAVFRPRC